MCERTASDRYALGAARRSITCDVSWTSACKHVSAVLQPLYVLDLVEEHKYSNALDNIVLASTVL